VAGLAAAYLEDVGGEEAASEPAATPRVGIMLYNHLRKIK
jgi:hypothetical protein